MHAAEDIAGQAAGSASGTGNSVSRLQQAGSQETTEDSVHARNEYMMHAAEMTIQRCRSFPESGKK